MYVLSRFWRGFSRIEFVLLSLCLAVLAYVTGSHFASRNIQVELPPVFVEVPQESEQLAKDSTPAAAILVHVAGAVRKPGVVNLSGDARVQDALHASGGATAEGDLQSLNLAARLEDGQQVVVPRQGEAANAPSTPGAADTQAQAGDRKSLPAAPVNVNTASGPQLETLPGVGPALAGRIIAARSQRPFRSLHDLDEVKGLGPKKLEKLQPYVTF